jgi:sulfur-oxidizing protein SoxY
VKASGGCSAPAIKADKTNIGENARSMEKADNTRTAQIMICHPNNSGLLMDQITRLYIPSFFVHSLLRALLEGLAR